LSDSAGGALTLSHFGPIETAFSQVSMLPPPETSGIEHIVVLMMENRSFDHMLGWPEQVADFGWPVCRSSLGQAQPF
jgi:phospholipase C